MKLKRRRIFFLESYISFFKLSIDEDNYLLLNFVRSDQVLGNLQIIGILERFGDNERDLKMIDSEGEVVSSGEFMEEDVFFFQLLL